MKSTTQTELVFQALASPARRQIMDLVKKTPGCCLNDVCEHFPISRIGVMKHLQILVDAKLVISQKHGRTRQLFFNVAPIQLIYDRWTDEYSTFWATQVVDLKYQVEGQAKKKATARKKKQAGANQTKANQANKKSAKKKKPVKKSKAKKRVAK